MQQQQQQQQRQQQQQQQQQQQRQQQQQKQQRQAPQNKNFDFISFHDFFQLFFSNGNYFVAKALFYFKNELKEQKINLDLSENFDSKTENVMTDFKKRSAVIFNKYIF